MLLRVLLEEEEEGEDTGYRKRGVAPGTTRPALHGRPKPKTTGGRTRYAWAWLIGGVFLTVFIVGCVRPVPPSRRCDRGGGALAFLDGWIIAGWLCRA